MAKFYSSTFGQISGKHGSAVAVTREDGTTYIRIYTKPSNPRTEKQQAHRAKFALSSRALVPFNPIFKDTIGVTNGISTARSHAFKNAIVGEYPSLSVDYEKIMFSFGPLEKLHDVSVGNDGSTVTVNWDFRKMYNCHGDDSVNLVVFNKDSNQALHIKDVALRSDMVSRIDIQDTWVGSELYFWAYSTCGDKISDSVFVGKCVLSSKISDSSEVDARQDNDAYVVADESDNIEQHSRPDLDAKGAIMSVIMMIYNFLFLFKQSMLAYNICRAVNALKCRVYGVREHKEIAHKQIIYNSNLRSSMYNVFEVLYGKDNSIFTTIPIPMMSTNAAYGTYGINRYPSQLCS